MSEFVSGEEDQFRICFSFLNDLNRELQSRVDRLENLVSEYKACHLNIKRYKKRFLNNAATSLNPLEVLSSVSNKSEDLMKAPISSLRVESVNKLSAPNPKNDRGKVLSNYKADKISIHDTRDDALDKILKQARELRLQETKSKQVKGTAAKISSKSNNRDAEFLTTSSSTERFSKAEFKNTSFDLDSKTSDNTFNVADNKVPRHAIASDTSTEKKMPSTEVIETGAMDTEVLKILDGSKIERILAQTFSSNEITYQSKSRILSVSEDRVAFPFSSGYYSIKSSFPIFADTARPFILKDSVNGGGSDNIGLLKIVQLLKDNRLKYEKFWRRTVKEIKFSNIGEVEREELFRLWYENQILLEMCESIQKSGEDFTGKEANFRSDTSAQAYADAFDNIASLPYYTPVQFPRTLEQVRDTELLRHELDQVDRFNFALQTRTQFAIENIISRTILRNCVRKLKHCVLESDIPPVSLVINETSRCEEPNRNTSEWIESLKLLRNTWKCLVADSDMLFVNK